MSKNREPWTGTDAKLLKQLKEEEKALRAEIKRVGLDERPQPVPSHVEDTDAQRIKRLMKKVAMLEERLDKEIKEKEEIKNLIIIMDEKMRYNITTIVKEVVEKERATFSRELAEQRIKSREELSRKMAAEVSKLRSELGNKDERLNNISHVLFQHIHHVDKAFEQKFGCEKEQLNVEAEEFKPRYLYLPSPPHQAEEQSQSQCGYEADTTVDYFASPPSSVLGQTSNRLPTIHLPAIPGFISTTMDLDKV